MAWSWCLAVEVVRLVVDSSVECDTMSMLWPWGNCQRVSHPISTPSQRLSRGITTFQHARPRLEVVCALHDFDGPIREAAQSRSAVVGRWDRGRQREKEGIRGNQSLLCFALMGFEHANLVLAHPALLVRPHCLVSRMGSGLRKWMGDITSGPQQRSGCCDGWRMANATSSPWSSTIDALALQHQPFPSLAGPRSLCPSASLNVAMAGRGARV